MDPKLIALLRMHDACRGLSEDELAAIADQVEVVELDAGDTIHNANEKIDGIYIVVSGRLKLMLQTPQGGRQTIRFITAGDQFGSLMLVSEERFPLEVIVEEDATTLKLPRERAGKVLEEFPVFRRNLLRKLGTGVRDIMLPRHKRAASRVVLFINTDAQAQQLVVEIAGRLAKTGEQIGVFGEFETAPHESAGIRYESLSQSMIESGDTSKALGILSRWQDLQRIFIVLNPAHSVEAVTVFVQHADLVLCTSITNDFDPALELLRGLMELTPSWQAKTSFVWMLGDGEQTAPLVPQISSLTSADFKVASPTNGTSLVLLRQGIDRVVHYLRGVSVGIALSGGAAHGMAHLGVLQALEEAGIAVDRLSGTSAGVLTGVLYGSGMTPQQAAEQFAQDLNPGLFFKWLPKGEGAFMLEKYRSGSWDPMLRKYLYDWRLEQLVLPVSTVTTDLISAASITRTTGDAVDSILESINLPVLSPPICRNGQLLVDGGILNNLPANVLVRQGSNFVIGADVAANIQHRVGDNDANTPTEKMKAPNVLTTLLRCFSVQAHNMSDIGARPADVTVAPDVSDFDSTQFTMAHEMAQIGYEATMEAMPRIRQMLNQLDSDLFPMSAD